MGRQSDGEDGRLTGSAKAWIRIALMQVGFDATVDDINKYIGQLVDGVTISEAELARQRPEIRAEIDGTPYSKSDRLLQLALELTGSSEGRSALREAMRRMPAEKLLGTLGLRHETEFRERR